MEIKLGSRVRSKAGRDKGDDFIVIGIENEFAYIADGNLRKVEKPKKKKLKHLQGTNVVSELVVKKIQSIDNITNSEVRKALAQTGEE